MLDRTPNNAFFKWVNESNDAIFGGYKSNIHRYQEGCLLVTPTRIIRLIYSQGQTEEIVEIWLSKLETDSYVCNLVRAVTLFGIEIAIIGDSDFGDMSVLNDCDDLVVFDIKTQLPSLSQRGLLVMDMDSTAIQIECIDELAKRAGVGKEVSKITELAMEGKLDFEQSLRQRVKKLAGLDALSIKELCTTLPLSSGLIEMIAELKSHGWHIAVASGGFIPFVQYLKDSLHLDAAYANNLVIKNNVVSGELMGDIVDAEYKAEVVSELGNKYNIDQGQKVAIGDGANDIPMLKRSDFGIAYYPKAQLKEIADACIEKLDLRVLVFLLSN